MKKFINFLIVLYLVVLGATCVGSNKSSVDMTQEWLNKGGELTLKYVKQDMYKESNYQSEKIILNKGDIISINQPIEKNDKNLIKVTNTKGEEGYINENEIFNNFEHKDDSNTLKIFRNFRSASIGVFEWGIKKLGSPITVFIILLIISVALIFFDTNSNKFICKAFPSANKSEEMYFDSILYKLLPSFILIITSMFLSFKNGFAINNFLIKGVDFNIMECGYTLENMMNVSVIIFIIFTITLIADIFVNYSIAAGIVKILYIVLLNLVSILVIMIMLLVMVATFITRFFTPVLRNFNI